MVHMVIVEPARDLAVCQCCLHYSLPFDVYHISHVMHSEKVWGRHGSQSTLNLQQNKSASWVCSWSFSEFLDFTSTCCQLSHVTTKHLPRLFRFCEKSRAPFDLWCTTMCTCPSHEGINNVHPWSTHTASCVGQRSASTFPGSYVPAYSLQNFKALKAKERCIVYTSCLRHVCPPFPSMVNTCW